MKQFGALLLMTASLTIPSGLWAKTAKPVAMPEAIRHELAMLPNYTVFDELQFSVDGGTVTLSGQVTRPILKDQAADAARRVEGVSMVVNNIEVLPLSPNDDRVRLAVYRAIYGAPSLSIRYGHQAAPPIRIIVKNGVVRLEGFVISKEDRDLVEMRAKGVFGAFAVENDLRVG
jgi:hyperosmotically inducible protein